MSWSTFAVAFARALHRAGAPTPVVEEDVVRVLAVRGLPATVMATPTALWVDVDGSARVLRLEPGPPDLSRQAALHALADRVVEGLDAETALAELDRIEADPGPYGAAVQRIAFVGAAASAAVLFGGTASDLVTAVVLSVGVAGASALRHPLAPFLSALAAGVGARLAAVAGADETVAAFAALIVLAPGMSMTVAAGELAGGHLASGTSRAAGAIVSLVQLAAGLALARAVPAPAALVAAAPLPDVAPVVVGLAAAAIGVLHRVRPKDLPWAIGVAGVAWAVARLVPGLLGAGVAAAVATVLSNGLGARLRTPQAVYAVPALTLLVPGTMGMRGVGELLGQNLVSGLGTALDAAAVAMALAAGTLVGQGAARGGRGPARTYPRPAPAGSCP